MNNPVIIVCLIFFIINNSILCQENKKGVITFDPVEIPLNDDCSTCSKPFGKSFEINVNLKESASIVQNDSGIFYTLKIIMEDAIGISIIYDDFFIPPGAIFIVESVQSNTKETLYSYNSKSEGIKKWMNVIGEEAIIKYFEPKNIHNAKRNILIGEVIYITDQDFYKSNFNLKVFSCHNDVSCQIGDNFKNEIRSVVRLHLEGDDNLWRFCTGFLINNERNDGTPYILTAYHCMKDGVQEHLDNATIVFNYQSHNCDGTGYTSNFYSLTGLEFLSGKYIDVGLSGTDFALLKITQTIPSYFNAYYAGWDRLRFSTEDLVSIHHPDHDQKKISIGDIGMGLQEFYKINWESGTTEEGSSGAPLIASLPDGNFVIGQLSGHFLSQHSCSDLGSTYFGMLSYSWDAILKSNRVKDWLDPDDTGLVTCPGFDPNSCVNNSLTLTGFFPTTDYQVDPVSISSVETLNLSDVGSNLVIGFNGNYSLSSETNIRINPGFRVGLGSTVSINIQECIQTDESALRNAEFAKTIDLINKTEVYVPSVEANGLNFKVYPNPFTSHITLNIELEKSERFIIYIIGVNGEVYSLLLDKDFERGSYIEDFDLSSFPSGNYLILINSDSYNSFIKILKE